MGKSLLEIEAAFRERYPQNTNKTENVQAEKTVAQESKNTKEAKRFEDIQPKQVEKPVSSVRDFRDIQPKQETKSVSGARDFRDTQQKQETKPASSVRDFRDIRLKQEAKTVSDARDFRDTQQKQETKPVSNVRDFRDIRSTQETNPVSNVKDFRNIQPKQEAKLASGGKGIKLFQAPPQAFLISEILFYFSLVAIILCTVLFSGGLLGDRALGGRRFVEMSTASMESVYSNGSLLIVQELDASELKVGDDISFVKDALVSVTHRIVEVREDEETQARTFITQGVDNPSDEEEVLAGNVIGRVDKSISGIGSVLSGVTRNLNYVIGVFIALMIVSFAIKLFWREK
jgi:signal peptidase I, archaeal type